MFFVVFFPAFLSAGNVIKTSSRFLDSGIAAVTRTVSAKFTALIPVFIHDAVFVKAAALAIGALALALTVFIEAAALAVETLALTLLTLTVPVKASLAVKALSLALLALTIPVKASLAVKTLSLALLTLTVPVKTSLTVIKTLALTLLSRTVKVTILVLIGPVIIALRIHWTVRHVPVLAGVQIAISIILSCSGRSVCCFYRGRAALYRPFVSPVPAKYTLIIRRIAVFVLAISICCGTLGSSILSCRRNRSCLSIRFIFP
jgi:hypothetical protein